MMIECCEAKAFHFIVLRSMYGRSFFRTVDGYMGSGPPDTRAEDHVALISGYQLPMVIRPCGNAYRIVGAAYIHGFMYGEQWLGESATTRKLCIV